MYVKYELRKPKSLVVPRGPSFTKARATVIVIDGTVIKYKAPKHRPPFPYDPVFPKRSYKLDEMIFRSSYSESINVSDNWDEFNLVYNLWAFYGPWFTGTIAILSMSFRLVKPVNYENDDFSLFHPRAFENIVADYLTNRFSRYTDHENGKHYYIAPINWQPLQGFPTVAVRLEVIPDLNVITNPVEYFVFFPVSDKVMAFMHFRPSQLLALPQEELDKRVDRSTMLELMNNIIDSVQLTLSPEAQAQQKAALAGLEDTSLVKEFLPLKWDKVKQDSETKKLEN